MVNSEVTSSSAGLTEDTRKGGVAPLQEAMVRRFENVLGRVASPSVLT